MAAGGAVNRRLTIGQLAQRCRLPISTLRYYHEIGLLLPAHVGPESGYRYYDQEQVAVAALVGELRALGLAPNSIAVIVADPSAAGAELERQRDMLAARLATERRRLAGIEALIERARSTLTARSASHGPLLEVELPAVAVTLEGTVRATHSVRDVRRLLVQLRRSIGHRSGVYAAVFPLEPGVDPMPVTIYV